MLIDAPTDGTDATRIILDQIAQVPDGDIVRFKPGRYRCDFPLRLEGRHDLLIEGPSSTAYSSPEPAVFWTDLKVTKELHPQVFVGTNSQRQHWVLSNCSGITLRDLHVQGPNDYRDAKGYTKITPPYEAEHAFFLPGSSNILIEDCSADSPYGDGVFLGAGSTHPTGPNGVTVRRFNVKSCGRTGIGLTRCSSIVLDGVTTWRTGTGAISFEPNGPSEYVNGVVIRNCVMDARQPLIPAHGVRPINDVWVHHNTFAGSGNASSWPLIRCAPLSSDPALRSSGWLIEDNRLEYVATGGAFSFEETDGVIIRRNSLGRLGKFRAGVVAKSCTGVVIEGNDFGQCLGLYELTSTPDPAHCGNRWNGGASTDDACA